MKKKTEERISAMVAVAIVGFLAGIVLTILLKLIVWILSL